jgi:hypothetical protein
MQHTQHQAWIQHGFKLYANIRIMIQESQHWKAPLKRAARWIDLLVIPSANPDKTLVRLERELLVGFYSIRKLLEAQKCSTQVRDAKLKLQWHPINDGMVPDHINRDRVPNLYDLNATESETRDLKFICDQWIHSYVLVPVFDTDGKLMGTYLASDITSRNKVYFITRATIVNVFRSVANDDQREAHFVRDPNTRRYVRTV